MFHASYEPRLLITNAIEQSLEGFWWLVSGNRARPVIGTLPYLCISEVFQNEKPESYFSFLRFVGLLKKPF